MKLFVNSLTQSDNTIGDISPIVNTIEAGVDITHSSIAWFTPYKSSDFPEIICDKDYFFIWSTDHDDNGGIDWGKGNNLDLSDFEEVGAMFPAPFYSAETPFLVRYPNHERPIHLYYHTTDNNPANVCGGSQETNLRTSNGGDLSNISWTQEAQPMECFAGQTHSGYLRFWDFGTKTIGTYLSPGVVAIPSSYGRAVTTDEGFSFTRINTYIDYDKFLPENRAWLLIFGSMFKIGTTFYFLTNSKNALANVSSDVIPSGRVFLIEINDDLEVVRVVSELNHGNMDQLFSFYVEGNTAHFYRQTGRLNFPLTYNPFLGYATLDIEPLYNL